ncbi:MAG: YajQ family cyclic di-GMP-binding protein [Candidatus Margulisiibacteriota bacterium]|nr:MAG: YajQ family cyclic di-GMP-binding protein [Candidatus Margulisbacteria bacterium GWD2_39_127]OGI02109.1 MAG: YajQ family cyclic di-GMP-binding protein [Candidatus Margulisbacteria bacterium GWF2_38_17]OGI10486.1 MAG: YajQ family cyclic di-GMP-binding protein [Candidatus Margulisbacteria bacterium GWE2_39_32]PZM79968.1 MAG: YajQ family cyclic di-GMP-binding protein [Candidatus Margulisiibacteriota bacterium]HAR62434.1 YajQ family cyclic di-GMP-binding protein [Candidatus Margulisiibacter
MAKESSFDIVSQVDLSEVDNALSQSQKELSQRFDFKGSIASIVREGEVLKIVADDDMKLKNVCEIIENKLVKRGISIRFLDYGKTEHSLGGNVKQEIKLKNGISSEKAKEVNKLIKSSAIKVNSQIQGDQIRVIGKNKDDLQAVITYLKKQDIDIELQFINYR